MIIKNKSEGNKMQVFQVLFAIYFIIAGIAGLYFNWLYAVENGFLAWLFFGEIIASLKVSMATFFINF